MNMSPEEQQICIYNQTGFCKFREKCFNKQIDQICEQSECRDHVCKSYKRHPKPCKKFSSCRYCYYNESCAYKHEVHRTENSQREPIKSMVEVSVGQQKDIVILKEELRNVKSLFEHNDYIRSIDILKEEISLLKKENRDIKQKLHYMEEEQVYV